MFAAAICVLLAPRPAPAASEVTRATLSNGLRVVIIRNPLAPVVTVMDNYLVGANETPAGFPGMAHAQEHMAFRGCAGVSADQTAAIFALLGGAGNADTQQNITQYFVSAPAKNLDVALRVDAACMRDVVDSQAEWLQERGAIEQEVAQDLSNPVYKFISRLNADMFGGTPYAHDPLGTRPSFERTTGALLKKFFRDWYAPNNAILVIAGDVQPGPTLALVKKLYGGIPARALPKRPTVTLRPIKAETFTLSSDLPVALAIVSYRFPGTDSPDFAAASILSDVLSSQRADLYGLVPQGKALFAGFQLAETYSKSSVGFAVAALPSAGDAAALNATMKGIIANYLVKGVPAELVDAAKRHAIAGKQFRSTSIMGLAQAWSQALAGEGRSSPDADIAALQAVSVADVNRVARKYLRNNQTISATLVPKPSGKPAASKGFGGSEVITKAPTKPVVLPSWAQASLGKLSVPASNLAPADMILPNGLRLIVQRITIAPTVTLVGEVKSEDTLQTPAGKEGVADVLEGLFSYGTTSLDRLAFQKALDDIAARESAGSSFSLDVLKERFDRGVQLLADNELHPALPEAQFPIVQQQTAESRRGEMQSPDYFRQRAIDTALYPKGDPALRESTPETIATLALTDVQNYYARVFRPDMTTIVVVGDITPQQARASIEHWFGGWTAQGPKPQTDLPPVQLNAPAATVVPDASRVQDATYLVENIGVTRTDPDYYALQVGNNVLGGGFYASRLYRELRQKAGYVYYVDNQFAVGKTRSTFNVDYGSDPPNVSKARALVERELRLMQQRNVTATELVQAKALLLRKIPLREASESSIAGSLLRYALSDLPLNESVRAAQRYFATTADQVRAAFAKWVRPADFVQVVQGPNPK